MKRIARTLLPLFAALATVVTVAESITVSTGDYEPYTLQTAKYGGLVNRVVKEAFQRKGVTVTFNYVPWARALYETKDGKNAQASSFWFPDKDRDKDYLSSAPITEHRELLFHLKSKPLPKYGSVLELTSLKFGATRGYSYTPEFLAAAKAGKLKVDETATDEQSLQKLLAGRIDVFPLDEVTGWKILSDPKAFAPGQKDLVTTGEKPFTLRTGHLLFPKSGPQSQVLLEKFNAGLQELKADGTLDKFKEDMVKGIF